MALYTPFIGKNIDKMAGAMRDRQQRELTSGAYMGDEKALSELSGVNPELAERIRVKKMQGQQADLARQAQMQKQNEAQQKATRDAATQIAKETVNMDYSEAVDYSQRRAQELGLSLPPMKPEHHEQIKKAYGEPPKEKTGFEGMLRSYLDAEEGSEEKKILGAKIKKDTAQSGGISIDKDGNIQIGGPVAIDKSVSKGSQDKIISAGESLARLDRIKSAYEPSFLTYKGKLGKGIASVMSKAGMDLSKEDKDMLRQHRKFTQGVNSEFNAYRKVITGAAASMSEMEDLKKAMISTDLSPDEFEAAFNEYTNELARTIRIRNKVMREGIKPGTQQYGEEIDRNFLTGDDDSVDDRGDELESQGMSDDEIIKTLESEGYI
jgi:hypothetical protein